MLNHLLSAGINAFCGVGNMMMGLNYIIERCMILLNTTENDHKIQFDLFWPEILLCLWCLSYNHESILQKEKQIL